MIPRGAQLERDALRGRWCVVHSELTGRQEPYCAICDDHIVAPPDVRIWHCIVCAHHVGDFGEDTCKYCHRGVRPK